ncbi:polyprenyl synthetase family protein [Alkalicoccus luteus]|uniref:Heptaprenyl diphosphate synthase n=1 Tax=Alkalicoccus luteus TaxID=1237094 RepID=A0A969PPV1_9BACI|nr:polyprenyl synthetase family protein [Alkalicoccus luteus]NJP38186.1 heptaprenyl diphosphate synthase [Alkalicoccus luteus]
MKLAELYRHVKPEAAKLEKEIESAIVSNHDVLERTSSHILQAGGKRIRPVFVLLSAKCSSYDFDEIKKVAVPLELIHMASLVHDDVIDDADTRRGRETIKSRWDNRTAMYTGDFLFAKAIQKAAESQYLDVHPILSRAMREMCIGEIEQLRDQYNADQSLKDYLRRIRRKTALLISVSCELGAVVSGADESLRRALKWYGYYAGMAFQITDDILDFTGSEKELGKPAGSDLIQGNITLPALYAMQEDKELNQMIRRYTNDPERAELPMDEVIRRLRNTTAVARSRELADAYVHKAVMMLKPFSGSDTDALVRIAHFIGGRRF